MIKHEILKSEEKTKECRFFYKYCYSVVIKFCPSSALLDKLVQGAN